MKDFLEQEELYRAFGDSDILKVFKHFLAIKKYGYNLHTGFVLHNDKDDERTLESGFRLWCIRVRADIKSMQGVPGQFNANSGPSDAIRLYKSEKYTEFMSAIKAKLKFDFTDDADDRRAYAVAELGRFVEHFAGERRQLDVAVLYSFIWQVKRKLFGKRVDYHIMPIFYSNKQGSGKTVNMHRICLSKEKCTGKESELLAPLTSMNKKSEVLDERNRHLFATSLIIKSDEFEVEKEHYQTIKSLITDPTVEWRPMRTNDRIVKTNKATMIGTSNIPLDSIIFDETGVRRFYQVNARAFDERTAEGLAAIVEQMEALANIDYDGIWKCVDENRSYAESYHAAFAEELNTVAEDTRNKGDFELYLDEAGIKPGGDTFVKTSWINSEFKNWAKHNTSVKWLKKDYKRNFAKIGMSIFKTGGFDGYKVTLSQEAGEAYANWVAYDEVRYKDEINGIF